MQGSCIGLYMINRAEWVISELACAAYSYVSVPLYDTLGKLQLLFKFKRRNVVTVRFLIKFRLSASDVDHSLFYIITHPSKLFCITGKSTYSLLSPFAGADAVKYIVNHAEVAAVFCTQDKLQTVSCYYLDLEIMLLF